MILFSNFRYIDGCRAYSSFELNYSSYQKCNGNLLLIFIDTDYSIRISRFAI